MVSFNVLLNIRSALHSGVLMRPSRVVAVPRVPFATLRLFIGCFTAFISVTRSGCVDSVLARLVLLSVVPGIDVAVLLNLLARSQFVSYISSYTFF